MNTLSQSEIDSYLRAVAELAAEIVTLDGDAGLNLEAMMSECASTGAVAAKLRHSLLSADDWNKYQGFLEMGFFVHADPSVRIAWFALRAEVTAAADAIQLRRYCEPYAADQPLFVAEPRLVASIREPQRDADLLDEAPLHSVSDSEVFLVGQGYAKLVPMLSPRIPAFGREIRPQSPRFVRLNPYRHYRDQPLQLLTEAAIVPADPSWLAKLSLHGKSFAHYELLDNDKDDAWDYQYHRVRRLEVSATRRDDTYLSMMIEELPAPDDPSGVMVGRCMHLDTRAKPGTPLAEATLQHLDLAINCYEGPTRAARLINTLQYGKSEDATYRTHLYRIEDAPFETLFDFAAMFFRSRRLLVQWFNDFHPSRYPPL